MVKPATKHGKGTAALSSNKSSWNPVDVSTGKTNHITQGVATSKKSPSMCSWSLKTIKTRSSSVKSVATASEVGSKPRAGDAPVAGQISHSRKVSKSK